MASELALANLCKRLANVSIVFHITLACVSLSALPLFGSDTSLRNADAKFSFQDVCKVAEDRLKGTFSRKVRDLPCELVGLDYDSWRYIAYESPNTIWRKEGAPFQVETGHRGYLFLQKVELNEVKDGRSETLPFNPQAFQYRDWLNGYRFPRTLGHSGWKLLGKFNDERPLAAKSGKEADIREIASFMGASYFRLLGSKHLYGSSTRGLAVDCAMPHPEEFPVFTEYWLEQPTDGTSTFRCWAILESERVIGAYQFDITPDVETIVDVRMKLFVRGKIEKLGIAPITSMWMWGGGTKPPVGDSRPEVHDADGLIVVGTDNSRLWRPLSRPAVPIVNRYAVPGLSAFGIVQRQRDKTSYSDTEAMYERRPSIMIEPKSAWPAGGVELLRLPASHEGIDNIGAFYLLSNPPQDGESVELEYRIHVCDDDKSIVQRISDSATLQEPNRARFIKSEVSSLEPGVWKIELIAEREGTSLENLNEDQLAAGLISLWNESGTVTHKSVELVPAGVKVSFQVESEQNKAFELLLRLNDAKRDLTEMWSYRCEP